MSLVPLVPGDVRAHPNAAHPHVEVPIIAVAVGAFIVVVLLSTLISARPSTPAPSTPATASWDGSLGVWQWVTRAVAVLLLVLAILTGRVGADDELDNLAPALVVGAGWPLLLLGCVLLGRLWRWVDPWDALARVVAPGSSAPGTAVWPAVVVALPLGWYVAAHSTPLDPRHVGAVVAGYTVLTLAGCLALGRERWLSTGEPVGMLLSWAGLLGRRSALGWQPPAGAAALLAVGIAGTAFGAVRRTELWTGVLSSEHPVLWSALGYVAFCGVAALAAELAVRTAAGPAESAAVVRALLPVFVGISLAFAVARDRLFTSVQLLPGLLGDPFGRGWDLLGSPTDGLVAAPLGAVWLVTLQLVLVIAAHLYAAASAPRPVIGDARLPAIATLGLSVSVCVTAMSLH